MHMSKKNCGELHWRWRSASRWVSTIYISLKGLCQTRRMCVPVKTNLKTSARFFKFCRKFWKAVFISFNLSHRLIVSEVFFFKNRSVVITEEFYCVSFETLCPWFFFFTWIYSVLFSAAVLLAESLTTATPIHNERLNLRWNLSYSWHNLSVE